MTVLLAPKVRHWQTSKYPLRFIIRACFLVYMLGGLIHFSLDMPPTDRTITSRVYNMEYLTVIGFMLTQLTMVLACVTEFHEFLRPAKVYATVIVMVVEAMISGLYWSIYSIDFKLIAGTLRAPALFQDFAAHLVPFLYLIFEFFYSRSSGHHVYRQRTLHLLFIPLFTLGYFLWITWLFWQDPSGYPYKFLRQMGHEGRLAFSILATAMSIYVYGLAMNVYIRFHRPGVEEEEDDDCDSCDSSDEEVLPNWLRPKRN